MERPGNAPSFRHRNTSAFVGSEERGEHPDIALAAWYARYILSHSCARDGVSEDALWYLAQLQVQLAQIG